MPPVGTLGNRKAILAIVPVDDTHMMRWQISIPNPWAQSGAIRPAYELHEQYGYQPETSGFLGKWRMVQNRHNDYLLDREYQKNGSYTGIKGNNPQDAAAVENQGPGNITDRSKERLGTSDTAIISGRPRQTSSRETGIVLLTRDGRIQAEVEIDANGLHTRREHPLETIDQAEERARVYAKKLNAPIAIILCSHKDAEVVELAAVGGWREAAEADSAAGQQIEHHVKVLQLLAHDLGHRRVSTGDSPIERGATPRMHRREHHRR